MSAGSPAEGDGVLRLLPETFKMLSPCSGGVTTDGASGATCKLRLSGAGFDSACDFRVRGICRVRVSGFSVGAWSLTDRERTGAATTACV